jgi:hypothetical protein
MSIQDPGRVRGAPGAVGIVQAREVDDSGASAIAARTAGDLAAGFDRMGSMALQGFRKEQDFKAKLAGSAFGARTDANGNPVPLDAEPFDLSTEYGRTAFSAASEVYTASVRGSAAAMRQELLVKHPADSAGFSASWKAYQDEVLANAAPELKPFIASDLSQIGRNGALDILKEENRLQRKATAETLERDQTGLIEETTNSIYRLGPEAPEILENRAAYGRNLDAAIELGLMSPAGKANSMEAFDDMVASQTIMAGLTFGMEIARRQDLGLSVEQAQKLGWTIANRAATEMGRLDGIRNRRKAELRTWQNSNYQGHIEIWSRTGSFAPKEQIIADMERGAITPGQAQALLGEHYGDVARREEDNRAARVDMVGEEVLSGRVSFAMAQENPDFNGADLTRLRTDLITQEREMRERAGELDFLKWSTDRLRNLELTPDQFNDIIVNDLTGRLGLSASEARSAMSLYRSTFDRYWSGQENATGGFEAAREGRKPSRKQERAMLSERPDLNWRDPANHRAVADFVIQNPGGLPGVWQYLGAPMVWEDEGETLNRLNLFKEIRSRNRELADVIMGENGVDTGDYNILMTETRDGADPDGVQAARRKSMERGPGQSRRNTPEAAERMRVNQEIARDLIEENEGFGSWFMQLVGFQTADPTIEAGIERAGIAGLSPDEITRSWPKEVWDEIARDMDHVLQSGDARDNEAAVRYAVRKAFNAWTPSERPQGIRFRGFDTFGFEPAPAERFRWERHPVTSFVGPVPAGVQYNSREDLTTDTQWLLHFKLPFSEELQEAFGVDSWLDMDVELEMIPETIGTDRERAAIYYYDQGIRQRLELTDANGNRRQATRSMDYDRSIAAATRRVLMEVAEGFRESGSPIFQLQAVQRAFMNAHDQNILQLWDAMQDFGLFKGTVLAGNDDLRLELARP